MRWLCLLFAALVIAPGCKEHGTLVPLAGDDNSIAQDELVGRWIPANEKQAAADDPQVLFDIVKRKERDYLMTVERLKDDVTVDFEVVPFVVGKYRFLQLRRKQLSTKEEQAGLLRVCYFVRYDVSGDDLDTAVASTNRLKQLLEEQDLPLLDTEKSILYTGEREPMLAFLEENAEELYPKFNENSRLKRVTEKNTSDSEETPASR